MDSKLKLIDIETIICPSNKSRSYYLKSNSIQISQISLNQFIKGLNVEHLEYTNAYILYKKNLL